MGVGSSRRRSSLEATAKRGKNGGVGRGSVVKRREAVRADTEESEEKAEYVKTERFGTAKTEPELATIRDGLKKNDIFGELTDEQVALLAKGFELLSFDEGATIIKQGDKGDHFYVVHSGTFYATLAQENAKVVAEYAASDSFGELALLYNSPRAATVTCSTSGKLWALERKKFRRAMVHTASAQLGQRVDKFLKSVPILSGLTDAQRVVIAENMEELKFNDGEFVMRVGEVADALYFVKQGELHCHPMAGDIEGDGSFNGTSAATGGEPKRRPSAEMAVQAANRRRSSGEGAGIVEVRQGEVLGESCLEPTSADAIRKADVIAVGGEVTVLRLTAEAFKSHIGVLAEVVQSNFKQKVMDGVEIDGIKFFKELSSEDYDYCLREMQEVTFEPNQKVIEQYKPHSNFYVVKSGTARAVLQPSAEHNQLDAPKELATLSSGEFFGERALLTGDVANCTVVSGEFGLKAYTMTDTLFSKIVGGSLEALLEGVVKRREAVGAKPPPPKFDQLELRRILGVGTFGRVKLVVHTPTGDTYALKCMRKAQVIESNQLQAVVREKSLLAEMEHPFILRLVQTYQDAGELYILMELALGGELFTLLQKRGKFFDKQAIFYVANVVAMFAYMHSLRCVYRDLKPENLLLDDKGYLKLVDFGFAKRVDDGKTFTLCGTPEYLAPEVILNKGHAYGADWWCVGILAFECLTGSTPFVSQDPMEGYRKSIKGVVPWPSSNMIGPIAKNFIQSTLAVNPLQRLGCLKGGSRDVKGHEWFAKSQLDYRALERYELPAPFLPKVKSATDDSNFGTYTDEALEEFPESDFAKDLFADFADEWV